MTNAIYFIDNPQLFESTGHMGNEEERMSLQVIIDRFGCAQNLATIAGVSPSEMSRLLAGTRRIGVKTAWRIAKAAKLQVFVMSNGIFFGNKRPIAKRSTRKGISPKLRFAILARDKFACHYCGKIAPNTLLSVDHIIPVSKGGGNEESNLITACFECNAGKSDVEFTAK